jgi:hypothetical protein
VPTPVPAGSASGPGRLNESGILCQARPPGISSQTNAASRVPREASHHPAMDKITINFGSPFGSLTIISSSERQWAQQGSNLRPLACKTSYYGRWTWLDVA